MLSFQIGKSPRLLSIGKRTGQSENPNTWRQGKKKPGGWGAGVVFLVTKHAPSILSLSIAQG